MDANELSGLTLAYLGDAAWEIEVRKHLIEKGLTRPKELHRQATHFVSAKAQCHLIQWLQTEEALLNDQEVTIFKRGRNSKSHSTAKNADVATYRMATGFEALLGYLYIVDPNARFKEVAEKCINYIEVKELGG